MKKFALSILILSLGLFSYAQKNNDGDIKIAKELIQAHLTELNLSKDEANQLIIYNTYLDNLSGARLIYAFQGYKGIPVFHQIKVMAFKNGKLFSDKGDKIEDIEVKKSSSEIPTINSLQAANLVLLDRNGKTNYAMKQILATENGQEFHYDATGICIEKITTKLFWYAQEKEIKLAWNVFVSPIGNSDYWQIQIDAHTGAILNRISLTDHCSFEAHPNGFLEPDKYIAQTPSTKSFIESLLPPETNAITTSKYRVIPYPAEAPSFPGGAHTLVTDPWNMAPGNATTLKWNTIGTTDYNTTRGNNVWAQDDRDNNNSASANQVTSTTILPNLTFDFTPDYTVTPTQTTPVKNQQFNVTNLFYWNNVIHDVLYLFGFDEQSANFQGDNMARGGVGNDFVYADAQDGGGTNNANFSTPEDGLNGRMQMYLWTGTPQLDGDVDNGVICHEYGHGISNRFTGGGTSGCLYNNEQMGEGWADYNALMLTQDWANTNATTGYSVNRGIGTYVKGQASTGLGIRSQRYGSANTKQYLSSVPSLPHDRGEIWAATLWDMTWKIIAQTGQISNSMYDLSNANAGNVIAFKLVNMGMKLQKCNPGFLDGRDGILAADQLLYGGAYRCAIMNAFATRGMGFDAKQGSTFNTSDQVVGYSKVERKLSISQSVPEQTEGLNVTYTHTVPSPCVAISNYTIRDTLPTNVSWISGGTYNSTNRVVSFTVNQAAGAVQNYSYTVSINNGAYFSPINYFSDNVSGTTIPTTYNNTSLNTVKWSSVSTNSNSAPNSYYCIAQDIKSDMSLAINTPIPLGSQIAELSFYHMYKTETGWDGGVVEISKDNGTTWVDAGNLFTLNSYKEIIGTGSNNPLALRNGYSGSQPTFIQSKIDLIPYVNKSVLFRFRFGSDDGSSGTNWGWWIDDISLKSEAKVYIRSSLYNASNVVEDSVKISTMILQKALPVSFIAITAKKNLDQRANHIQWRVANESGILNYELQRSNNGIDFSPLKSNIAIEQDKIYDVDDINPLIGDNFYRAKAYDQNGSVTYSDIVKLSSKPTKNLISIYPNPILENKFYVRMDGISSGTYYLNLINSIGQKIMSTSFNSTGSDEKEFSVPTIKPDGIYILSISDINGKILKTQKLKMVK